MKKECSRCHLEKETDEFRNDSYSSDGFTYACKKCLELSQRRKKIRIMTPEQKTEYLVQLIVRGETINDCSNYFECSIDDINITLSFFGYSTDSKWCPQCKKFKNILEFSKDAHNSTGYKCWCNNCFNKYRKQDEVQERIKIVSQEYYLENKEAINQQTAEYYERTKEERKDYYYNYYQENAAEHNLRSSIYRAVRLQAMPSWVDKDEIRKVYKEARRLTLETGILHAVDHIFALQAKDSCGLHVPWNLQILTFSENCAKGNRNNHPSNFSVICEINEDDCV